SSHNGAINVQTAVGQGSTFQVLLPVGGERVAPREQPPRVSHRGRGTVLVVDDEEIVREIARALLERQGYAVMLAENGRAAVELFARHSERISVVLLDLAMPVMSGEEAIPLLQMIRPDVKLIVSTGFDEQHVRERLNGVKVAGIISKPYTSE